MTGVVGTRRALCALAGWRPRSALPRFKGQRRSPRFRAGFGGDACKGGVASLPPMGLIRPVRGLLVGTGGAGGSASVSREWRREWGARGFVCSAEPPVLGSGPGGVVPREEGRGPPLPAYMNSPGGCCLWGGGGTPYTGRGFGSEQCGVAGRREGSPCARSAGAGGLPAPAPTTLPKLPVRGGTCAAAAATPPPPDYTGAARAAGAEPGRAAIA